jgi:hypothetical protein
MRVVLVGITVCVLAAAANAETSKNCSIAAGDRDGKVSFSWGSDDCAGERHCHNGSTNTMVWSKWSGIAPEDLQREGASIDARMKAEAGEMRCVGLVHDGALRGSYSFTPDEGFRKRVEAMGFGGVSTEMLQGYAMLDVTTTWIDAMKQAHVTGMSAENLMGLRALGVDAAFVRAMSEAGYPELGADKLTSFKAVGVSPEKVRAVRAMGFAPTEDELVEMSVFKIDAAFVERMKARGFKNPTISQLVQIKVFKLDE